MAEHVEVPPILRMCVRYVLMEFLRDKGARGEVEFPSALSGSQRSFTAEQADLLRLRTMNRLLGWHKHMIVYKKEYSAVIKRDIHVTLSPTIQSIVQDFLEQFPLTKKDRETLDTSELPIRPGFDSLIGTPKVPTSELNPNMLDFKKRLPIYKHLNNISEVIFENQISFILGDPGSGKTSQLPQLVMDECKKLNKPCYIVCTQHSRLAAAFTAHRVALERNEEVGNTIGFECKLDRVRNDKTLITYCSMEVLLQVMMTDAHTLRNLTHLFVDDIQDRNKILDLLLIALKESLKNYPNLRVILMAANIDTENFSMYFDGLAIYQIDNHWCDVKKYYFDDILKLLEDSTKCTGANTYDSSNEFKPKLVHVGNIINYDMVVDLVMHIFLEMPRGTIVIFVPRFEDIITLRALLYLWKEVQQSNCEIITLHSTQSIDHSQIYSESCDFRKIIISTEFAEASVTVYDVAYVVDLGMISIQVCNSVSDSITQLVPISRARMDRRALRAGRTKSGKYFVFQTKNSFENISADTVPQICRGPISDICLMVKCLAPDVPICEYLKKALNPPDARVIENSVASLISMEALDSNENLTGMGHVLSNLSVAPHLGKILLYACIFKCIDPVLTIVCCLSVDGIFQHDSQNTLNDDFIACKHNLSGGSFSDHMAILQAFEMWSKKKIRLFFDPSYSSCVVNEAVMEQVVNLRTKLVSELRAVELIKPHPPGDMKNLNINSRKWYVVKAVLFLGLYPNIATVDYDEYVYLHSKSEPHLNLHPYSSLLNGYSEDNGTCLENLPTQWIMYGNMFKEGLSNGIECNTLITFATILLLGGLSKKNPQDLQFPTEADSDDDESNCDDGSNTLLSVDEWIAVYFKDPSHGRILFDLRQKLYLLVTRKLHNPLAVQRIVDNKIIETITYILEEEEANANLVSPLKVGQRPHKSLTVRDRTVVTGTLNNWTSPANVTSKFMNKDDYLTNMYLQSFKLLPSNERAGEGITKYFLVKSQSSRAIRMSQKCGLWNLGSNPHAVDVNASSKIKTIFIFCDELAYTFFGCAQLISKIPDEETGIIINWLSKTKIYNSGTIVFLKFLCNKYENTWSDEVTELAVQCGKYLENLLRNPLMKTSMGRPIKKKH